MTIDLEYDEQNVINKKINATETTQNFNSKLKNLVQLTGYSVD